MEVIQTKIHKLLIKNKKTIAIAESCTGGQLSNLLTQISGSSRYFILGIVAYSNKAKIAILKIPARLIAEKGAVSKDVATAMAKSVRKIARTDLGIGITGIAGPAGATEGKPIGTVFIAVDGPLKKLCKEFHFRGKRLTIRRKAASKCLELLRGML